MVGTGRQKSVGLAFALVSSITFGGSGPFAKALIAAGFSPEQAAWLRILGAAVLLVPFVLILRGNAGSPPPGATGASSCSTA